MINTHDVSLEDLRERARLSMGHHAIMRMWQRRVTEREMLLTVVAPRWVERNSPGHPIDRSVYCNGHIRVIVRNKTREVVTIEIEGAHTYDPDQYVRPRPPAGPERLIALTAVTCNVPAA